MVDKQVPTYEMDALYNTCHAACRLNTKAYPIEHTSEYQRNLYIYIYIYIYIIVSMEHIMLSTSEKGDPKVIGS